MKWKEICPVAVFFTLLAPLCLSAAEDEVELGSCHQGKAGSPHRRKGGEAFPPLPLPATPLRRTEKKRPPAPPTLITRVRYGDPRSLVFGGERVAFQDWNSDPACLQLLLRRAQSRFGVSFKDEAKSLSELPSSPAETLILFVTGQQRFEPPPAVVDRLREFVSLGGYLWLDTGGGVQQMLDSYLRLCSDLFPNRPVRRLPPDHPVFRSDTSVENVAFTKVVGREQGSPVLLGVDLGCRTAIFLSPYDLSCGWEGHVPSGGRAVQPEGATALGMNMLAYCLACRDLGEFLSVNKVYVDQDQPTAGDFVFGQVKWAGNYDPDPTGPINLLKETAARTSAKVRFKRVFVTLTSESLFDFPFLYMTGHEDFTIGDTEAQRLRAYLEGGGFLLADACCGRDAFALAFEREIAKVLGAGRLKQLEPGHEVFSSHEKISAVEYTPAVLERHKGLDFPVLMGADVAGATRVIFSRFDLGNGWEGIEHPWALGYEPRSALSIGVNVIVYALTH